MNIAKPAKIKLGYARPVWAEADDWYKTKLKEDGLGAAVDAADAARELVASAAAAAK